MENKQEVTETAAAAVRVTHHTERPVLPTGSAKAKAYFDGLHDHYECCFRWGARHRPERSELRFYSEYYTDWIEERNRINLAGRHTNRIISVPALHEKARTCPEELTVQLTAKEGGALPAQNVFRSCIEAYVGWMQQWSAENGNCLHVLGAYIAKDTLCKSVIRRVWDYVDDDGIRKVGQSGALCRAGIQCPDEEAEESRFNNRKMTFDRISREALYGFLEDAGVAVIREPRIYTLRQAEAARDEAEAAEKDAAAILKELMELEAQAPQFNEDGDVPGAIHENGKVKIPEEVWRLLKIRESLEGAYEVRANEVQVRLDAVLAEEQEELMRMTALRGALEAAEMEYVRLCRGLMRLGYNPTVTDETDGLEGGDGSEGIPYKYEEAGLSEP